MLKCVAAGGGDAHLRKKRSSKKSRAMPEAVHSQESAKMFECEALLNFLRKSVDVSRLKQREILTAWGAS